MAHLHFKNAAAAEMLLRTHQGTRMALKIVSVDNGMAMVRLVVTLDGEELMSPTSLTRLCAGDLIEVPQEISVRFTTA